MDSEKVAKSRIWLSDKRVQKIRDNGESQFYTDNPIHRRDIQEPKADTSVGGPINTVRQALGDAKVWYPLEDRRFIPRSKYADIMNPERVLEILYYLPCFKNQPASTKQDTAKAICFGLDGRLPALKVFGALIAIKIEHDLVEHMEAGLNDGCLPLKVTHGDKECHLQCGCSPKNHASVMNSRYMAEDRENFLRWTRCLTAPYISCQEGLHSHYVLDVGNCIPIKPDSKVVSSSQRGSHSQNGTLIQDGKIGHGDYGGGYSEVFKVKLQECHYRFQETGLRNSKGYYAIKKLTSHARLNFEMELSSLLFSADQRGNKKHMIQVLATFEEVNSANNQSTFYLLFDCAEGDLERFWRRNEALVGDSSHCPWMSQQLLGLGQALQAFHNDRQNFDLPKEMSDMYGRHGDIKPSNILFFKLTGKEEILALADFGLGRLHTKVSRSKQNPRLLSRTETYRAPEFDLPEGLVGPTSDVYSLGCVFLEYITWFLRGPDSPEKFSEDRMMKDIYGFEADTFFVVLGEGDQKAAEIKPAVKEWIKELKEHEACSWYLVDMLELIENKMLEVDKDKRIRATLLVKKLGNFSNHCEQSKSYYMENWKNSKFKVSPADKAD